MSGLFDNIETFPSKSVERRIKAIRKTARRVVDNPELPPGRYSLTIQTEFRPYGAAVTVDVLRVYDDNTVDIRVVKANFTRPGYESNVPLSWDGGRRVFTEVK